MKNTFLNIVDFIHNNKYQIVKECRFSSDHCTSC